MLSVRIEAKRGTKSLLVLREKSGSSSLDWCFDAYKARKKVREEANLITERVECPDTLDDVTEFNFLAWVRMYPACVGR